MIRNLAVRSFTVPNNKNGIFSRSLGYFSAHKTLILIGLTLTSSAIAGTVMLLQKKQDANKMKIKIKERDHKQGLIKIS